MIDVEVYIDMNKYFGFIYYTKKVILDNIKSINFNEDLFSFERNFYDVIEKQYFTARPYNNEDCFVDMENNIMYNNLHYYEITKNIDKSKVNHFIAETLNFILNSDNNIEIDDDIRIIVLTSALCECDDRYEVNIGKIEYSTIRFEFKTKYKDVININEIKKYLNKDIQNRIKFVDLKSDFVATLILPLDDDELVNMLKKFLVLKQLLLI